MTFAWRLALVAGAVVLYYQYGKRALFRLAPVLARATGLPRRLPLEQVTHTGELLLAGLSHLALVTGAGLGAARLGGWPPVLLVLGALLGIAEMSLSALICRLLIGVIPLVRPAGAPAHLNDWLTVARAGWMRHHMKAAGILPLPLSLALSSMNVIMEEMVFRGVIIGAFLPFGPLTAVAISTVLFAVMQAFLMPSAYAAMFPVVGALVMGVVHGLLFLAVPSVWPLVAAHMMFFFFAIA